MVHITSSHKIAILTILVLIGITAILVPLMTIGGFGIQRSSSQFSTRKEAIAALKHAQTELSDLKKKITKLLNITSPEPVHHRKRRQAEMTPSPPPTQSTTTTSQSSTTATVTTTIALSSEVSSSSESTPIVKESSTSPTQSATSSTISLSTATAAAAGGEAASLTPSLANSSSTLASSLLPSTSIIANTNETTTESVEATIDTEVDALFNTVFGILDKISAAEKLFSSGDYSKTGSVENLIIQLHDSTENFFVKNSEDAVRLAKYLLTKINTEESKLTQLITELQKSEVTSQK